MDLSSRNQFNNAPKPSGQNLSQNFSPVQVASKTKDKVVKSPFYKWSQSILLIAVSVVLLGLLVFLTANNNTTNQSKYIISSDMQAVFLNTGQVYFGNIKSINNQYVDLVNIFYLQSSSSSSSSSSSNSNLTLVKLGCEIHAPLDQMIINASVVTFWENLSPNGQVSKAAATYWKEYPHGQQCVDQSTAPSSGSNSTQPATTNTPSSTIKK